MSLRGQLLVKACLEVRGEQACRGGARVRLNALRLARALLGNDSKLPRGTERERQRMM